MAGFGERDVDSSPTLEEQIRDAETAMIPGLQHFDLGPMIALLQEHTGDMDTTLYICESMEGRASYCWTWASQLNTGQRAVICDRMVAQIGDRYEEECRLGIGRRVY